MFLTRSAQRQRAAERAAISAALKRRVEAIVQLGPDDAVALNEIACPDPGCPDQETVILIMRAGQKTRATKIAKPMDGVDDDDLFEALILTGLDRFVL